MSSLLKYSIILFCFFLCFIKNLRSLRIPQVRFLLAALFFTGLADYFLVFTEHYLAGLLFFCLVQVCYCRILGHLVFLLVENGLLGAVLLWMICILLRFPLDLTALLAGFYITCLLSNIFYAWRKKDPWFAMAVTLLLLCDIHVGISHLSSYLSIPSGSLLSFWCQIAPGAIWFFYIPSQIMISLTKITK